MSKNFVGNLIVVACAIGILWMLACEQKDGAVIDQRSQSEKILSGDHKLRKMTQGVEEKSKMSTGIFLLIGQTTLTNSTSYVMKFAWKMNDGMYAISSLPIEKIRVKFDESVTEPTIKFRWTPYIDSNEPVLQTLMDQNVTYAVLTIREKDWPVQITPPLNQ